MVEGTLDYMGAEALPAIVFTQMYESNLSKKGDQKMRDKHFS